MPSLPPKVSVSYEALIKSVDSFFGVENGVSAVDMSRMREALESAAPLIAAQALDDAASAISRDGDPGDGLLLEWLRDRSNRLRAA